METGAAAREAEAAEGMTAANDYPVRQVSPPVGGRRSLFKEVLGTGDFRQVGPGNDIIRLPVGVHTPPPSVDKSFSTNQSAKRPLQERSPAQRSPSTAAEGRHRAGQPRRGLIHVNILPTTKKSGEWRPILNLKPLNAFIKPKNFRMETLAAVIRELHTGWWGATLDLKDAYLHVPV